MFTCKVKVGFKEMVLTCHLIVKTYDEDLNGGSDVLTVFYSFETSKNAMRIGQRQAGRATVSLYSSFFHLGLRPLLSTQTC